MDKYLDSFNDAQLNAELGSLITFLNRHYVPTVGKRQAFLLGGQSGAGKTTLHGILAEGVEPKPIIVNGDEYRKSHPHFSELNRRFGKEAVDHTAAWAGKMTEALIDSLSGLGYNLIIEGTLRTSAVPLKTAELLRARSYGVSLALMAVKPEISLVSCKLRYDEMRLAGTTPRATNPQHHMKIVEEIVGNLNVLEQSGLFDEVFLYTRSEKCLYPREGEERPASEVLHEALFGEWSDEEKRHLAFLEKRLAVLERQG